jgi:hypothetical protein
MFSTDAWFKALVMAAGALSTAMITAVVFSF